MAAKIRKGDKVIVLSGRDKGRTGEVFEVRPDDNKALVRGVNLVKIDGRWIFRTAEDLAWLLRKDSEETRKLSRAAIETLAIIAYRQPITAPEVSEIRGVNSTQTIRTLLERRMIRVAGRKNVVGSPFLYRTTKDFLVHFGLNDVRDMPRLEEFGDLIGESMNEDLVAAIATAPQTSEHEVTEPATSEEAAANEAAALDELARQEVQSGIDEQNRGGASS